MKIVEKILIALLVILLPVGILFTNYVLKTSTPINESVQIDAQKLKIMVDRFGELEAEVSKPKEQIVVSSVSYASESGNLTVMGTAPTSTMTVMMSATVLPPADEKIDENVLGSLVGNYWVLVKKDRSFSVDIPIKNSNKIVEVRLDQNEIIRTIRYDLDKNLQIL